MQEFTCLVWLVWNAFVFVPTTARYMLVEKDPSIMCLVVLFLRGVKLGCFPP